MPKRELVTCIQGRLRRLDAIGRIGGDEFLIVLPHTERQDAEVVGEDLRRAVAAGSRAGSMQVSITVGAAEFPKDGRSGYEVMETADVALMASKRGRAARAAASSVPMPLSGSRSGQH